jgi:hypothetical protein
MWAVKFWVGCHAVPAGGETNFGRVRRGRFSGTGATQYEISANKKYVRKVWCQPNAVDRSPRLSCILARRKSPLKLAAEGGPNWSLPSCLQIATCRADFFQSLCHTSMNIQWMCIKHDDHFCMIAMNYISYTSIQNCLYVLRERYV